MVYEFIPELYAIILNDKQKAQPNTENKA